VGEEGRVCEREREREIGRDTEHGQHGQHDHV